MPINPAIEPMANVHAVLTRIAISASVNAGMTSVQGVILNVLFSATSISCECPASIGFVKYPTQRYVINARVIAGIEVNIRKRICRVNGTPHVDAARTVVSLSGDTLSPKYAPEIIAPATHPGWYPITVPILISATPIVAIVLHELPVITETIEQIIQLVNKKVRVSSISNP